MAKRRTRKQKESAHHQFTISWTPSTKRASSEASVKRQIPGRNKSTGSSLHISKNASTSALDIDIATIKKEIRKSLILASAILAMELVLYLFWR